MKSAKTDKPVKVAKVAKSPAVQEIGCVELDVIFEKIKTLMEPLKAYFPNNEYKAATAKPQYHLCAKKDFVVDGRKHDMLYFASIIIQKGYVGFYYMPVYCDPKRAKIPERLAKLLKGKSCFHIKTLTPELEGDIAQTLQAGLDGYRKMGWI